MHDSRQPRRTRHRPDIDRYYEKVRPAHSNSATRPFPAAPHLEIETIGRNETIDNFRWGIVT